MYKIWFSVFFRYIGTLKCVLKTWLTKKRKAAAIRKVEKGLKMKSLITKECGVPFNTLSTCLRNKWKILSKLVAFGENRVEKRAREPENLVVKECVLKWFKENKKRKNSINLALLNGGIKTENFALQFEKHNFKVHTVKSLTGVYKE